MSCTYWLNPSDNEMDKFIRDIFFDEINLHFNKCPENLIG